MTEQITLPVELYNRRRVNSLLVPWTHPLGDFCAVLLWFWTTARMFVNQEMFLYPLTLYFMIGIYLHWRQVGPVMARGWPVILLAAWAMCSFIWSDAPTASFKISLQMLLSVLICCYVAARVPPRAFVLAIFIALTWFQIMSLPQVPTQLPLAGAFNDKNYLALRMSVLAFAAAAIVLDKGLHRLLRIVALPVLLLAMFMVYRSQSATSAIVGFIGLAFMLGAVWIWQPARGYRVMIVALAVAIAAALVMYLGRDPQFSLMDQILIMFGKDSTLTGRHELWAYAQTLIEQRPWLGVGPGAFWLPERLDAQALLDTFYKPRGTNFSFHNSYLEIGVYLGLVGLAFGLVGWIWSGWINIWRVLKEPTLAAVFFGALTLVAAARSYVESDLWRPFEFVQMIVWIGALAIIAKPRPQLKTLDAADRP